MTLGLIVTYLQPAQAVPMFSSLPSPPSFINGTSPAHWAHSLTQQMFPNPSIGLGTSDALPMSAAATREL